MYKFLLVAFLAVFIQRNDNALAWSPYVPLEWSDFQGRPRINGDVVAVTASGLSFVYSTKKYADGRVAYDFEVTAHFYPERSYYLKDLVTDITLKHERLHFDITELHARKFRAQVKATRFTQNIDAEMEQIHREINDELREMQRKYDEETDHSRVIEHQIIWNKMIAEALEKTKHLAEY